jgi:hypothetical protein
LDWLPIFEKIDRMINKTIMGCCNALMADYPVVVRVRNATNCVIQFPILTPACVCGKKIGNYSGGHDGWERGNYEIRGRREIRK